MSKVNFRTNVLLKSIIGKDLITDDNIAVLELVKNSFDAGSLNVDLTFVDTILSIDPKKYKKQNSAKIVISDMGVGMSEYDLVNKWLNIAYSEKKIKTEEFNRTLAGNKGVGRFSCDRLGKFLTIYTKQTDSTFLKLRIDWRKFEQIDNIKLNIQDIELELEVINSSTFSIETGIKPYKSGTTLVIESLREIWNHEKILSLKRQLEKLINPNQSFKSERFEIRIIANEYLNDDKNSEEHGRINGLVENKIFQKLDFKASIIQTKISRDGRQIITILKDRGKKIFSLVEKNPFPLLKDIKIHLYYLNPYSKAYFKRQTGIRSVDFGSISFFINGFRIPPYGDPGDDWLGMDNRKNQGRARYLGNREVIGRIEVNHNQDSLDDDNQFKIISNRSGVRNNEIFTQLTKDTSPYGFYYKSFRRLERFVVEGISWDSVQEKDYKKLERKVLNDPHWNESKEEFLKDNLSRNRQILGVIDKIISSKEDDIIELKINNSFVVDLVNEQKIKTEGELNAILEELERQDLTSEEIRTFISKIDSSNKDLNLFPLNELKLNDLKLEQEKLKLLLEDREKGKREAEEETARLKNELELEKEKNTYLTTSSRSLTEDAKGLVHNIKITSKKISDSVDNLYHKINDDNYTKQELLKSLGAIKFQSEKAKKISKIITRSNFKADRNAQVADVVNYIKQYIDIYSDIYPENVLNFNILSEGATLTKKFSLLDMSVVLDDLISNSEKANAKYIEIEISNSKNGGLDIYFSDDGIRVPKQFLNDPEKIFELGITTTKGGSGIGLNLVQSGLKSMKGSIKFIGNGKKLKGACFKIVIQK